MVSLHEIQRPKLLQGSRIDLAAEQHATTSVTAQGGHGCGPVRAPRDVAVRAELPAATGVAANPALRRQERAAFGRAFDRRGPRLRRT